MQRFEGNLACKLQDVPRVLERILQYGELRAQVTSPKVAQIKPVRNLIRLPSGEMLEGFHRDWHMPAAARNKTPNDNHLRAYVKCRVRFDTAWVEANRRRVNVLGKLVRGADVVDAFLDAYNPQDVRSIAPYTAMCPTMGVRHQEHAKRLWLRFLARLERWADRR